MKTIRSRLKRVLMRLAVLMGLWYFVSFCAGLLLMFAGCPKWLELPWSAFGDFVETPDGRVYVEAKFYGRILCYDKNGKFIANYPGGGRSTKLAASKSGLIFLRTQYHVYGYDQNWETKFAVGQDPAKERTWILSADSKPLPASTNIGMVPDRAVGPGEPLFSPEQERVRESYQSEDGSSLDRVGDKILRSSKAGRVVTTYSSPWWFFPFKFKWPVFLSVPLGALFLALRAAVSKWERWKGWAVDY